MEGIIYRFKPIPAENNIQGMGGVDMNYSYKILMDPQNRWGRLNKSDVNIDPLSRRNATLLARPSYLRLAQALMQKHRYDSAVQVMDRGLSYFPNQKFPFDYYTIQWAVFYYQAGATEKANQVINTIYNRYLQDLKYYDKLQPRFLSAYTNDVRMALATLQQMAQVTNQYKQTALFKKINQSLQEHATRMQRKISL
jgi:tetratricopeptide (TPR) repeat protein